MKRRFLIPEVVQTSAMDCGPACLKALLEGHGVSASYDRLREACQTDVDGTSIDRIEEAAGQLGLEAEQMMLPVDFLFSRSTTALPAMIIVRMPNGATHFVVAWRSHGRLIQCMDPASGRRWTAKNTFIGEIYHHSQPLPAETWREWAGSSGFLEPLRERLPRRSADGLITRALADPTWRSLATLDAAARMCSSLIRSGGITQSNAAALLDQLTAQPELIPESYWSAKLDPADSDNIRMVGAVLLHIRGVKAAAPNLSPDLAAALKAKPVRPGRELLRFVLKDGWIAPATMVAALATSAAGVTFQALLFRSLFDLGRDLELSGQRYSAAAALLTFVFALLVFDTSLLLAVLRAGRRLECTLRLALLKKLPLLGDSFFRSRLSSDLAERSHVAHRLRQTPELVARLCSPLFEIAFTVIAVCCLYPQSALYAIAAALILIAIPLLAQPALTERDLRLRSHAGALTRFYMDAILGSVAIRAHGAEGAIRREQTSLLQHWAKAGLASQKTLTTVETAHCAAGLVCAATMVLSAVVHGGDPAGLLLLLYWALKLPALAQDFGSAAWQYPALRSTMQRFMEPLHADVQNVPAATPLAAAVSARGVAIGLESVSVLAAGNIVLQDIDLKLEPGAHVAIVGASGAGKSSLAGLLLGWHSPASGRILIDGVPLHPTNLTGLRSQTAWIDPQSHIWNRSLLENVHFGAAEHCDINRALQSAGLQSVLRNLPEGLQTELGEAGGLVSGGEGQRVRAARAMMRPDARLVILDEPARGLDRDHRRALLQQARALWRNATLIYITHDVADTVDFERVLVIDHSRIVEDGSPLDLAARTHSKYRSLLDAESSVRRDLWANHKWRRVRVENGRVIEQHLSSSARFESAPVNTREELACR